MASIAKKTRLSISQARRVVHGLIGDDFVKVIGNENGGPPGSSRQYQINVQRLTACMDARGTASAHATPSTHARDGLHGCAETASAHATPSTDARASTHARDGLHGCAETASAHASLTVIEPSLTVNDSDQASPDHPTLEKIPDCPHQQIIALYAMHLPALPQPRIWEGKRSENLRARWRWVLSAKRGNGNRYAIDLESGLGFFERFFGYVAASDFLNGRDGKWQGCDLAWLVKAENFAKVIEGKYENRIEVAA